MNLRILFYTLLIFSSVHAASVREEQDVAYVKSVIADVTRDYESLSAEEQKKKLAILSNTPAENNITNPTALSLLVDAASHYGEVLQQHETRLQEQKILFEHMENTRKALAKARNDAEFIAPSRYFLTLYHEALAKVQSAESRAEILDGLRALADQLDLFQTAFEKNSGKKLNLKQPALTRSERAEAEAAVTILLTREEPKALTPEEMRLQRIRKFSGKEPIPTPAPAQTPAPATAPTPAQPVEPEIPAKPTAPHTEEADITKKAAATPPTYGRFVSGGAAAALTATYVFATLREYKAYVASYAKRSLAEKVYEPDRKSVV